MVKGIVVGKKYTRSRCAGCVEAKSKLLGVYSDLIGVVLAIGYV